MMTNPSAPSAPRRRQVESLSLLARLLAAENIRVQHSPKAKTASFDTKARVLMLPVWDAMSGDLYDMLVAHEVAHALYSPKGDEWCNDLEKLAPKAFNKMRQYVNIVEDARIERMMKDRFGGLRSVFARAYRDLTETKPELFALNHDLKDLPLIDRVNIHYKVGFAVNVPFTDEEMPLVNRVAETQTWEEVVALAKEFYDLSKKQQEEEKQQEQEQGDESQSSDGDADEQDGEEQDSPESGETDSEGENEDAGESTEGGEDSDESSDGDSNSSGEKPEEDAEESTEQSGGSTKGDDKSEPSDKSSKPSKSLKDEETEEDAEESVTEKMMETLSKQNARESYEGSSGMVTLPSFNVEKGVIDFKEVIGDLKIMAEKGDGYRLYQEFTARNKGSVAALVQEFMRRKAADEAHRTRTADTGSIDANRLWSYRISDEIFGSYETKREGKNHGIVFLLDWSGSMNVVLKETFEQLACLVQFCAAASIPCEIYAFTDSAFFDRDRNQVWSKKSGEIVMNELHLLNLLSASARPAEIKTAIAGLLAFAKRRGGYTNFFGANAKGENLESKYYLNGTPLNAAIVAMNTLVPAFKRKTGVQIVNTVVLTDGDATDCPYYRLKADGNTTSIWSSDDNTGGWQGTRDYQTANIVGKTAVTTYDRRTDSLVRHLRAETGANVLAFRIDSTRSLTSTVKYAVATLPTGSKERKVAEKGLDAYVNGKIKFLKDNDWVSGEEWYGFTEWFGVSNLKVDEADYLGTVNATSTKAALAKALSAEIGKTKSSRPLMARIAARVSVSAK